MTGTMVEGTWTVDNFGYVNRKATMTLEQINEELRRLDEEWERKLQEQEVQQN